MIRSGTIHVFKDLIRLPLQQNYFLSHSGKFVNVAKMSQESLRLKNPENGISRYSRKEIWGARIIFSSREPHRRVYFPGMMRRVIFGWKGLRGDLWGF